MSDENESSTELKTSPQNLFARLFKKKGITQYILYALLAYLFLLFIFAPGRICQPVGSEKCISQAWNFVGDLVWLKALEDWQTLAAGILATVAAALGAYYINKQIQQSETHEKERLRREELAAKAALPLLLSNLIQYTHDCAELIRDALEHCTNGLLDRDYEPPNTPRFSTEMITGFQEIIRASRQEIGEPVSKILSHLQITSARQKSLTNRDPREITGHTRIFRDAVDIAELYARAEAAFDYARGKAEQIRPENEIPERVVSLCSSEILLDFNQDQYPQIREMAERLRDTENPEDEES